MPTTLNVEVTFELLTDRYPEETSWSLIDNSHNGSIVHSGPGDHGETYDADGLYSFMWTLNRCTSYTFTIYDFHEDGLASPGYAEVKTQSRKIIEALGRIDGDFGLESSISIYICDVDLTSSPSSSLIPSPNQSDISISPPTLSQSISVPIISITAGDQFNYSPWGVRCFAFFASDVLYMSRIGSDDGQDIRTWKCKDVVDTKKLLNGETVMVEWGNINSYSEMTATDNDTFEVIHAGNTPYYFKRA